MEQVDAVVVGAGVVGLAIGRALAVRGLETLVLEAESAIGTGCSARSSEVIHGGLYHATGSLKARLAVAGREALVAYCAGRGIGHRRCGKLVVATSQTQETELEALQGRAAANGVDDTRLLGRVELRALEPALAGVAALLSPATGIVDSHALMLSLQGDLERAGGAVVLRSRVEGIACGPRHRVRVADAEVSAGIVINAAGLWAPALAARTEGLAPAGQPAAFFAKGHYFSLSVRAPFSRLVYPVPEPGGLGIHLTLDLAGRARFGPDVEWIRPGAACGIDYRVDEGRRPAFETAIRRYWPGLRDGALQPTYSGVRPKIAGPGEATADFRIDGPEAHGIGGLVNLFGIESPGLTACLALADEVVARVGLLG